MKLFKRRGSSHFWATHTIDGTRHRRSLATEDKREARKRAHEWVVELELRAASRGFSVRLSFAIAKYLNHCSSNHLAVATIRARRCRLAEFLNYAGDVDIGTWTQDSVLDLVTEYLDHLLTSGVVSSKKDTRIMVSGFFNYLRAMRWYRGENPGCSKLHLVHKPRRTLRPPRHASAEEDLTIRRECAKTRMWPVVMLARWAGMRRGEAVTLRWRNINFAEGYADVVGEEGGRKHPRRVWLPDWIVMQLRAVKAKQQPTSEDCTIWPYHADTATNDWNELRDRVIGRRVTFNDLRASWVTEVFGRGMTAKEESVIGGHGAGVADKHYSDYVAKDARSKMPPDPMTSGSSQGTVRSHSA